MRAALLLASLLPLSASAAEPLTICVTVYTRGAPPEWLEARIEHELRLRPSRVRVEEGCRDHLEARLIQRPGGWRMQARLNHQPSKTRGAPERDAEGAFVELLTALLGPAELEPGDLRARRDGHLFSWGTDLEALTLPTQATSSEAARGDARLLTPLLIEVGRYTLAGAWRRAWLGRARLPPGRGAPEQGDGPRRGGHVGFGGSVGAGLRVERLWRPMGRTTGYVSGGPRLEALRFTEATAERGERSIYGGALALDLALGYDFMRASSIAFFVEVEARGVARWIDVEGAERFGLGGALHMGLRL